MNNGANPLQHGEIPFFFHACHGEIESWPHRSPPIRIRNLGALDIHHDGKLGPLGLFLGNNQRDGTQEILRPV
jgi:hypothetical protein